jgi:hypothetical protein
VGLHKLDVNRLVESAVSQEATKSSEESSDSAP